MRYIGDTLLTEYILATYFEHTTNINKTDAKMTPETGARRFRELTKNE